MILIDLNDLKTRLPGFYDICKSVIDIGVVFSDKLTKVYMNVPVYLYTLPNGGAALVTIVRHKDNPDEFVLHPITTDMVNGHYIVNTKIVVDRLPYGDFYNVNDSSIKQITYTYISESE